MSLIICDARFREVNKPNRFDDDITMILRKDIVDGKLVKTYTPKKFTTRKATGERKEVWIKYQETPGGKFKEITFMESVSAHKSISVNLVVAESEVLEMAD
jgi:hypothetical protein